MEGGAGTPVPPRHAPLYATLEPQTGSNLLNSNLHIYLDFLLFTICPFYDYFSNSFCISILFAFFFRGVSFQKIGNYNQMTNSHPSGRLLKIFEFLKVF